jgi:hypothetical protein
MAAASLQRMAEEGERARAILSGLLEDNGPCWAARAEELAAVNRLLVKWAQDI